MDFVEALEPRRGGFRLLAMVVCGYVIQIFQMHALWWLFTGVLDYTSRIGIFRFERSFSAGVRALFCALTCPLFVFCSPLRFLLDRRYFRLDRVLNRAQTIIFLLSVSLAMLAHTYLSLQDRVQAAKAARARSPGQSVVQALSAAWTFVRYFCLAGALGFLVSHVLFLAVHRLGRA